MVTPVLGIDVSADTFHVALQAESGWRDECFPNDRSGFAALGKWLASQGAGSVLACVEASGNYWVAVAIWLREHDHAVHCANPLAVHRFIQSDLERTKTDKQDARQIAAYCLSRLARPDASLRLWEPPRPVEAALRALQRRISEIVERRTEVLNRAQDPQVLPSVRRSCEREARSLLRERERLEREMDQLIAADPVAHTCVGLLRTIPGIGEVTARFVFAEIGDCSRFDGAPQLVAFAGLCPQERTSGRSVRGPNSTTRLGHRRLKSALYLPALAALRHDPGCQALLRRHAALGKPKMKTVVAIMRKLLHIIYGVLKTQTPYDPNRAFATP